MSRPLPKVDLPTLSIKDSQVISGKKVFGAAAMVGLAASSVSTNASMASPETHRAAIGQGTSRHASPSGRAVSAFAAYLASLGSQDQVSKEGLERATSLALTPISSGARYRSDDVGAGWHYIVEYFAGTKALQRAAVLQFVNEHDENAGMSPVCDVEFQVVRSMLIEGGYKESESLGEIGNFLAWDYSKNDITISLVPQATIGTGNQRRDCIRSIRMFG